jgi:hypothetical protein
MHHGKEVIVWPVMTQGQKSSGWASLAVALADRGGIIRPWEQDPGERSP